VTANPPGKAPSIKAGDTLREFPAQLKMSSSPKILRPKPRRPFENSSTSTPQQPSSPLLSPSHPDETPSRTHSILNLTSSTLLGIYSSTGYETDRDFEQPSTPWGTGAETPRTPPLSAPVRRMSAAPPLHRPSTVSVVLALGLRGILLFGIGLGYGVLVRHLHDERQLAPFQVEGIIKPRNDIGYLLFWGIAGVALGSLLPWVDTLFAVPDLDTPVFEKRGQKSSSSGSEDEGGSDAGIWGADWTPVVRSVGAFVGIAYAIVRLSTPSIFHANTLQRKLPWASTMQASLTLALVNPALWYLIDRSKPGFVLSTAVGATGTALLLVANPDMMPSPAASTSNPRNNTVQHTRLTNGSLGYISRESIEGGIWILSVLFCSCVCFGNIGRRLALSGTGPRKPIPASVLKSNGSLKSSSAAGTRRR
jgi:hypothetical protein